MFGCPITIVDTKNSHIVIKGEGGSGAYVCMDIECTDGICHVEMDKEEAANFLKNFQEILNSNKLASRGVLF